MNLHGDGSRHDETGSGSSFFVMFALLCSLGLQRSEVKPLWVDEIATWRDSVDRSSYGDILTRPFLSDQTEGNTFPLFYLIQKAIVDLADLEVPIDLTPSVAYDEPVALQVLRIQPVVFMALTVLIIFWYFFSSYNFVWAIVSLAACASTYSFWHFFAEARPYALWMFLCTCQLLLFLRATSDPSLLKSDSLRALAFVHILLSFTVIFSLIPILTCGLTLFLLGVRDFKRLALTIALPAALCLFYYSFSMRLGFYYNFGPHSLVFSALPADRLVILFLALIGAGIARKRPSPVYLFVASFLAATISLCSVFWLKQVAPGEGFEISNCYFVYLAPLESL